MKIKEFSQKNSVVLFWVSIFLLVVSIVFGVCLIKGPSLSRCMNDNFRGMNNARRMMQGNNGGNDFRNFNRNYPSKGINQNIPQEQTDQQPVSNNPTTSTTSVTPTTSTTNQ